MTNFGAHNCILKIDLSAIEKNYNLFQSMVSPQCAVAGICKANAYGTGLKEITQKLKSLNCLQFFVASLDEALSIRGYDTQTPIAVLGGVMGGEETTYTEHNITPVLNTVIDIENWQKNGKKQSAMLHIDTGMSRLGLHINELESQLDKLKDINLTYVMSHFVNADEKDDELTHSQHQRFEAITKHFPNTPKSLANSSGLFRSPEYHYDMVRPGYALYGGNPTPEVPNPMHPVVTLESRILQIRHCKKGETIGYGASHKFEKDTTTATLALGYADGFMRHHSNKATLYYKGQPCPVIGRVSMDLVSIDISAVTGAPPQQGDAVEILGPNQTIDDDFAEQAGTIGYEILTSLSTRYKREYIND